MKKLSIFAAILFAVVLGNNVNAQNTKTNENTASATIITPITLDNLSELKFGKVASMTSAETMTMNPTSGEITYSDNQMRIASDDANRALASYKVGGLIGQSFSIAIPTSAVELNGPNSKKMTVTDFTINKPLAGNVLVEDFTFNVGGTLNVGAGQEAGFYSGEFDVTVTYE